MSVARNHIPVRPRSLPACCPAANSSPLRWARVGVMGMMAEISRGSRPSPAKRSVTNALGPVRASVFIVEVAKTLAFVIGDPAVTIYDHATRTGKVAGCLDLVQRAAEVSRRHA